MHTRTFFARVAWAAICGVLWLFSWIIAEGIPVFNDVLGLTVCIAQGLGLWNFALMICPEFALRQLVLVRSPWAILDVSESAMLAPELETDDTFWH